METHLLIIGAGPGGYPAAFHAADLGLDVTLVDPAPNPGGVCLYQGCIPSKALLHAAKVLTEAKEANTLGIKFDSPKIDLDKLRNWKEGVITKLTAGLGHLCKQRKINYIQGKATFLNSNEIEITKEDGQKEPLTFQKAILATGSHPIELPHHPKSSHILNSTSALKLENIPESLLVVGGGYIGLELGTIYAALGSQVSVVEMTDGLLPGADRDLVRLLERRLKKTFESIHLNTKIIAIKESSLNDISVTLENKNKKEIPQRFEKALIAIGRKPNSKNIGLENTKVELDENDFVRVNTQRQTKDPNIYAIGDVAGEPLLAHKATHEAHVAVDTIAGKKSTFEPKAIPAVVFTDPEIAWCGLTEVQAKKEGRTITVKKFPWSASGRAITLNRPEGVTKLIMDPQTERVLGIAIAGPGAGEMIAEGVLALEMSATAKDLKRTIHPHPTLSETLMECAEGFLGQSTHLYKSKI